MRAGKLVIALAAGLAMGTAFAQSGADFVKSKCMTCHDVEKKKVRLDYRPVHMNTLDDEVESFPPKARVY